MDVLKALIKSKKRQLEEKDLIGPGKKYFKREELLEKEEKDYWKKHDRDENREEEIHEEKKGKNSAVSVDDEGNNKGERKIDGISKNLQSLKNKEAERIFPRKEVIKRLRGKNEPILLYGETESGAFQRLRSLEVSAPDIDSGFRNDFQEAMEKVDQAYLEEILKTQGKATSNKSATDVRVEDEGTNMEEIKEMAAEKLGKGNMRDDAKVIVKFLKYIQQLWGEELNSREGSEKVSIKGKALSILFTQTQDYLKPLFRSLKKDNMPEDIIEYLVSIISFMVDRNYVKANDVYLQMAIGNAPWPIGVTMVGIHARTGREKISTRNIAHVLNDETQRKFIQGVKRLITQCQRFFPTDPSRCVDYSHETIKPVLT